ncbi:MAG: transposase [Candidatus Eisenbacteria sp.]|nr:transposase [Candidatus Eisenbacteria bacterium]
MTSVKRSPPVALEVKLVAVEALEAGLAAQDIAEVVGVVEGTLGSWRRQHQEGGLAGLCRRSSSIGVRRQVSVLDERILAHRRKHPEHGVRRIRDELRRQNIRKPLRCHPITVSGLTMTRGRVQAGQSLWSATQNTRSPARSRPRLRVRR